MLPLARAAVAAGADGIIVEVHPIRRRRSRDAPQQIPAADFSGSRDEIRTLAQLMGRTIG